MEENGVSYPGGEFNYSDGRLTNSRDTDPASDQYFGVWHEQLAHLFLKLPTSTPSLDGGNDFAFGGATTERGTRDYSIIDVSDLVSPSRSITWGDRLTITSRSGP